MLQTGKNLNTWEKPAPLPQNPNKSRMDRTYFEPAPLHNLLFRGRGGKAAEMLRYPLKSEDKNVWSYTSTTHMASRLTHRQL